MGRTADPVALLIAGASVGAGLLLGLSMPAALGIGAVVAVVGHGGRLRSRPRPDPEPDEMRPDDPLHPQEERWIDRADDAVAAIGRSIRMVDPGPLRERLDDVTADALRIVSDLRRVAVQATATRDASDQLDVSELSTDLDRLTTTMRQNDDPLMVRDLQRSADAVREQLRIGRRLAGARAVLQARLESGVLGLQQLAAQVGEMTALAPPGGSAGEHGDRIDALTTQLEALRAGLSDAGTLSRRALGTAATEGGDDDPLDP